MKVLVTGATGYLGRQLIPQMMAEGWTPLAVDRKAGDIGLEVREVDLRQTEAVNTLFDEPVDALVHLANMSSWLMPEPDVALNQNLLMCTNLFQAARKTGVKKIVFASSIHAFIGLKPDQATSICKTLVPYLPLDGDAPAWPACPYGLMKSLGEQMLRFHANVDSITTFSLRLPWLTTVEKIQLSRQSDREPGPVVLAGGCSCLTYEDAAGLIVACLKSNITGNHVYMPAAYTPAVGKPIPEIIRQYYSNIPLRKPVEQITSLVDVSLIEKEVDWRPSL